MITPVLIKYRDRLILFIFPLILTGINSNWIFTPVTNYIPDPWFYLAYFRYFYAYVSAYPSNTHYFVERLTWNIPGYYLYKIFHPLQANYILHLIVYYVAIFSLYGILSLLFNRRTALISALLMGSYPWFLRAAGWDYTDGTGIAHMLLLIFLITLAQYSPRWRLWLLLAGAVHSSLLITNLAWFGYLPSWVLYFLILNIQTTKFELKQLALAASYFLLGNLITAGIAGLFYYWVTGDYFFLANSLRSAVFLSSDETNRDWVIRIYGHMRPYWHILPTIIALVSTSQVWYFKRGEKNYSFTAIYLLFTAAYGWLIFWHFYSIPFLIVLTYSSYVIPAVFILLGALLSTFFDELPPRQFEVFAFISIILLILPPIVLKIVPSLQNLEGSTFLILCFSVLLMLMLIIPQKRISILTTILTLSFLFYLLGEKAYVYISNPSKGRDNFLAIISASEMLDSYYPNRKYEDFRLWFRADENYDTFFSLAGLYLYPWGSAIDNPVSSKEPHTQLSLSQRDEIQAGDKIVIISSDNNANGVLKEANLALSAQNIKLKLETSKDIQQGNIHFFLYFTKATSSIVSELN
jgi:hypothetical protein